MEKNFNSTQTNKNWSSYDQSSLEAVPEFLSNSLENLRVRPMNIPDLDQVMEIEKLSFLTPWKRIGFEMELNYNDIAEYLVVCDSFNSKIILAYGGLWFLKEGAHLTTLAVRDDFRRKGLGSIFLEHLKYRARFRGAVRMTLEVRPSNQIAKQLYKKHSFTIIKVRPQYYHNEDALLMGTSLLNSSSLHRNI